MNVPHRGHGRIVCRHGALVSTCRCIDTARVRSVVDYCPVVCPFRLPPSGPRIVPPTPGLELFLVASSGDALPIRCEAHEDGTVTGVARAFGQGYDRLITYVDLRAVTVCIVGFGSSIVQPDDSVTVHAFSAPPVRRSLPPPTGPMFVPMNLGLDGPGWRRP